MKKLDGFTADIVAERIEELRTVFPEVFKDGKIDFDSLQNILGEHIEDAREKYSFTWAGKLDSIRLAQKRSNGTLRPYKEESVNFDTTQNLYIEGDNLEVLKLLSGSYMNSVKMIYIDPPYNTGNDFVYTDNFSDSIENYKKIIGETAKSNAETAGRYHTNWLNMMLPRLKLARVLLKQDGVIFISIDDNEQANLKKLCDEVFGEHNFIANICHKARASVSNDKIISSNHNIILLYCKNIDYVHESRHNIGLDPDLDGFNLEDDKGRYKLVPVDGPGGARKGNPYYEFLGVTGYWRFGKETMQQKYSDGLIVKTETSLQQKYYLNQAKSSRKTATTWFDNDYLTSNATKALKELIGGLYFDNPKNINLLITFLKMFTFYEKDAIILDFFSGSGTTAHAVMQLNAEDGGSRKFICIQIPELTDEKSEAYKAGYKNICEIGKERIRRAGNKIKDEASMLTESLDTGFKVFKLDTSNLKKWNNEYTRDYEDLANRIREHYDYLIPNRTPLDMVYEIMLKYSLPLTLPVTEVETAGITAHIITHKGDETVDEYKVLVCLEENLTIEQMEALSAQGCGTLFFADRCFTDTNAMTNCDEILKKAEQEMRLF